MTEREYKIINHNDTSSLSFFIYKSLNDENFTIKYKLSQIRTQNDLNDSSKVDNIVQSEIKKDTIFDYKKYIKEIECAVRLLSFKYDFNKISSFRFNLFFVNSLLPYLEKQSVLNYGTSLRMLSRKNLVACVQASPFVEDLNQIFSAYKLYISDIYIEEWLFFKINKDHFYIIQDNPPYLTYGAQGIDGDILCKISPISAKK